MRSLKEAWRKAGEIHNWDGAEDIDADHPDVIPSYTPLVDGWKFILSDGGLLSIVALQIALMTWLIAETVFLANAIPIWVKDSLSIVGMMMVIGFSWQLGWAAMAARADDMFAGSASGLATLGRTIRGALFLMPFGVFPAILIARLLSILVPVRIFGKKDSLVGDTLFIGRDGFQIPARYWHLMIGLVGASKGVTLTQAAELTVDCRLKVYDIAAEDSRRYLPGLAIGCLFMPAMVALSWTFPQVTYVVGLPVLLYLSIVIYHQAPAIVCLSHVLHTDFKEGIKEPELPPVSRNDRASYRTFAFLFVLYFGLMFRYADRLIERDLAVYDGPFDFDRVEAECREGLPKRRYRDIEDFAGDSEKLSLCVKDRQMEWDRRKRTLSQTIEDYIAVNKTGKTPTAIRKSLGPYL